MSGSVGLGISFGGHMECVQQDVYQQQQPTSSDMYYAPAAHYL
jgi:hypothetical protein